MLSKEDTRRLALLEHQLRIDDPGFCARMDDKPVPLRRRVPIALVLAAVTIWAGALMLGVVGWWIPAAVAAVWATVIVVALAYSWRRTTIITPPPIW